MIYHFIQFRDLNFLYTWKHILGVVYLHLAKQWDPYWESGRQRWAEKWYTWKRIFCLIHHFAPICRFHDNTMWWLSPNSFEWGIVLWPFFTLFSCASSCWIWALELRNFGWLFNKLRNCRWRNISQTWLIVNLLFCHVDILSIWCFANLMFHQFKKNLFEIVSAW